MNRCAMGEMETGGYLDGPDGLIRCHRPHGHHQRCGKRTGWGAAFVGNIHRDVFTFLHIPDGQAGSHHGIFK